ncbi:colicin immunity domain-containing protein [Nonomuraea sp. NPDC004580]|uniref:colicin immunity domain-containing protein n=1 Tax=Nonomuraea sp. NPDC004580 TaxID=3154552 RepID=UPI0033A0EBE1
MDNAILSTARGYSLVAGSRAFVRACLDSGIDEARVRFLRYARRLAYANPSVMAVSMEHPPRWQSWRSPREVHPESNTAQQLHLMESFVERALSAPQFVLSWLSARSQALDDGERLHGRFETLMNEVFYVLDDYPSDPALREDGDISEEELREHVDETLRRSRSLD